jgi:hypothetical protein
LAAAAGGALGATLGGVVDNILFPGNQPVGPTATASTYGNAIPICYGPQNRVGGNIIWSSGFRKVQNKSLKFLAGKGGQPYTYVADIAIAVGEGPWQPSWLQTIWANGTKIFDASAGTIQPDPDEYGVVTWDVSFETFQDFSTVVVYPGNLIQPPDPTMEAALGVGNVPAYIGTAYVVITSLKLTTFGNAIPSLNFLVQASETETLGEILNDICARSGIDVNTISTSLMTADVQGYQILSQSDANSAIQPLALCYYFDAAEVAGTLRFVPRGYGPACAIPNDDLGAYPYGGQAPEPYSWPRGAETETPNLAALTFIDPSRDCNQNTQSAQRVTGSAESNVANTVSITLTSDAARRICDRLLWEAQIGRQDFKTTMSDRYIFLEPARVFAFESPAGYENVRITKQARGINGVIELEGKRDYSGLYASTAPGATSNPQLNPVAIGGPVNPPLFIEPPSDFPGITGPTILIAVSGGENGTVNDAWQGCAVWTSTDNETYTFVGNVSAPACMGVLIGDLEPYSGSNPDTTSILDVSTAESGQEPPSISAYEAGVATAPYYVGGEFLSAETVTGLGGSDYRLTNLWRGLYGTHGDTHDTGQPFARLDASVFRFPLPKAYIGVTNYFKFVSAGETLASATAYSYNGTGAGYGTVVGGLPAAPAQPTSGATGPGTGAVIISPIPNAVIDNVTGYDVYRAPTGAGFSSATIVATDVTGTFTDSSATPGETYDYYTVANNEIGASEPSPPETVTVPMTNSTTPFGVTFSCADISTKTPSTILARFPAGVAWEIPANMPNSQGDVATAPTATTTFTLEMDGSPIATITWASGSTTATFANVATAIPEGDYLDLVSPSAFNGMAGAFGLTIMGTR